MFVEFNKNEFQFTFNKETVNIYIVYDLDSNLNNFDPKIIYLE